MVSAPTHHHAVDRAVSQWLATIAPQTRLCVAYSGGVDSSVLLHALHRAISQHTSKGVELTALHVHHGLSANADAWAAHCEARAKTLAVSFNVVKVNVEHRERDGVEAAARNARYRAFAAHLAAHPNAIITLAHHARDQAETVLLQLLRGAGPAGLAAMADVSKKFARPLLAVSKSAIDDYAQHHAIAHIADESNDDPQYARNRLRQRVWPEIIEAFPSAETTLSRAARWQHEADELARDLASIDFEMCSDDWGLSISTWRELSSARRRNVFRHWFAQTGLATQSAARLDEWERQLLESSVDTSLLLTHASFAGSVRRYRDSLCFVSPVHGEAQEFRVAWHGETRLTLPHGELEISLSPTRDDAAFSLSSDSAVRSFLSRQCVFLVNYRERHKNAIRANKIDDFVKELFQAFGVPPWLRASWPAVEIDGEILGLAGLERRGSLNAVNAGRDTQDVLPEPHANESEPAKWFSQLSVRWRPQGVPNAVQFVRKPAQSPRGSRQP